MERKNRQTSDKTPTIAPGMAMQDDLEEKATEEDIKKNEYTEVTRLYTDRTPND